MKSAQFEFEITRFAKYTKNGQVTGAMYDRNEYRSLRKFICRKNLTSRAVGDAHLRLRGIDHLLALLAAQRLSFLDKKSRFTCSLPI